MDQIIVFAVLAATLILFIHGRWRYDFVSLGALLVLTFAGIVPTNEAFLGFGHPAVVTVAAVLALSSGLQNAGVVDALSRLITRFGKRPLTQLVLLNFIVLVVSAFMNNVGALAILLPVALQLARDQGRPASQFLMPLAFSSLLGGMTTMIGTPPNIIVATMRQEIVGESFGMFSFSYVGLAVALFGFLFVSFIGWRLIPMRSGSGSREDLFEIEGYMTELRVPDEGKALSMTLREIEELVEKDVIIFGLVRDKKRIAAPSMTRTLEPGDILVVESDPESLQRLMDLSGLEPIEDRDLGKALIGEEESMLAEVVVTPRAWLIGRRVGLLRLRWRFGVTLLAVARYGRRVSDRLGQIVLRAGDVILLRGSDRSVAEALPVLGCLPLAERNLRYGEPPRIALAVGIFASAVVVAVLGFASIAVSFVAAVVVMHLVGLLRMRDLYSSIDWPIIVLLGAMIPVGGAMETTGGAQLIADQIVLWSGSYSPAVTLSVILIGTMFLSDLVNNATAAILMVPISFNIAESLGVRSDAFLMAVAIGASCPFLTPIGHQSNALVMGPGGYRFSDYWRMGLPLEIIITVVAIPTLLWFWPL